MADSWWGNPLLDPMTIFMCLTIAIPPLRALTGGWTNFPVPTAGEALPLLKDFFLDPVSADASFPTNGATGWRSSSSLPRPLWS
jgi:hypothetical protein